MKKIFGILVILGIFFLTGAPCAQSDQIDADEIVFGNNARAIYSLMLLEDEVFELLAKGEVYLAEKILVNIVLPHYKVNKKKVPPKVFLLQKITYQMVVLNNMRRYHEASKDNFPWPALLKENCLNVAERYAGYLKEMGEDIGFFCNFDDLRYEVNIARVRESYEILKRRLKKEDAVFADAAYCNIARCLKGAREYAKKKKMVEIPEDVKKIAEELPGLKEEVDALWKKHHR